MSGFTGDFYFDPNVVIKQEPLTVETNTLNISASVPIPVKRQVDVTDYRDITFDLETSQSPSYNDVSLIDHIHATPDIEQNTMWGNRIGLDMDLKPDGLIHSMDDDDIFQVDKADLIQGPTLAELNANETLLGDLNFDDLLLPEENSFSFANGMSIAQPIQKFSSSSFSSTLNNNNAHSLFPSSYPQTNSSFLRDVTDISHSNSPNPYLNMYSPKQLVSTFSPTSQTSSNSPIFHTNTSVQPLSALQQKHSTLHELLRRENYISPDRSSSMLGKSVPGPNSPSVSSPGMRISRSNPSRLSSSAPTHLGLEQIWQRREPRKHLLSTGSLAEAGSTSSLSTGGVLSPEAHDFSQDEFESDEDSDHYEDFSSDNGDSDDEGDDNTSKHSSKKERYFWQYNVQAKGPKGQRLVMKSKMEDPHVLNQVTDPVFSPDCSVRGIKHSGKARKGDGNDLTPNARKLYNIGRELDKLGRIINDMTPVSELPFNVRPKTRKEKNKLASRACRLKKKAQHEANKIKLHGLESEHSKYFNCLF